MMTNRSRRWLAVIAVFVFAASWGNVPLHAQDPSAPFFDDANLHEVRLLINSKDWEILKAQYLEDTYYPADFQWGTIVVHNVGIRSRGTGSRSGTKPGLRVDFDKYSTSQKFLGLKSFVLRNNTQDASNLHEPLAMALFRRMGMPAPREAMTKLYINNDYVGLYTIVEAIDHVFLDRNFGEHGGNLYEYSYKPTDPAYYFEYRGPDPASYVPQPFKPETNENDPKAQIFERLAWTINSIADPLFATAVAEYMDVVAFLRHVAGEVCVADQDGMLGNWGMNNYYAYRSALRPALTPIAWDKSNAFIDGPTYPIFHNITDVPPELRNRLFVRLMAYASFKTFYLDTLTQCAQMIAEVPPGDTRSQLEIEVVRLADQIRAAVYADTVKQYTNAQFEQEVAWLVAFAQARPANLAAQVAQAAAGP